MRKVKTSRKIVGWHMILVGVLSIYVVMGIIWYTPARHEVQELSWDNTRETEYVIEDEPIPAGSIPAIGSKGYTEVAYGIAVGCLMIGVIIYINK